VPLRCRATLERLQSVLDGEARIESLAADLHVPVCDACRDRIRAARALLSALSVPAEPVSVPVGFTDAVLVAVKADRRARVRRRVFAAVGGLAVAAAVLVGVWFIVNAYNKPDDPQPKELVNQPPAPPPEIAPAPRPKPSPEPAPEPRPLRIGDELKGLATFETPKPLSDSAQIAPKLFNALTKPFTAPAPATNLEPARKSLAELPNATRVGLEPVTDTAQKAFDRFLRDVGSVQPKAN